MIKSNTMKAQFVTTGYFLYMAQNKELSKNFPTIILDELHERSTDIDIALSILKDLVNNDPNFRVILMSATINTEKFQQYIGGVNKSNIIEIPGSTPHKIDVIYKPCVLKENFVESVVSATEEIANEFPNDDILVFLPGMPEVEKANQLIQPTFGKSSKITCLHGSVSKQESLKEISQSKQRNIILATNIAETSLTFDKLKIVIDSGKEKRIKYNGKTPSLCTVTITQASAKQRKGT